MEVERVHNLGSCPKFSTGVARGVEWQVARVVLEKSPDEDSFPLNAVGMNALGGWGVRIGGSGMVMGERIVSLGQIRRILRSGCQSISNPGSTFTVCLWQII